MEQVDYTGMIAIHGELFRFDDTRQYLIAYENERNINALSRLQNDTYVVRGYFNPFTKQLYGTSDPELPAYAKRQLMAFNIPKEMIKGTSLRPYDIRNFNAASIANKDGFCYVDKELSDRLNGKPATLEFEGLLYQINLETREISQLKHPEKKFVLQDHAWDSPSEAFYNVATKSPVTLSPDITEFPKDVVCVKFPRLNEMDVVGYAMLHELPGFLLITDYPWKVAPEKVHMVDVSQSQLAERVKSNALNEKAKSKMKTETEKAEKKDKRRGNRKRL